MMKTYAVSACLMGRNCKYNGGNNFSERLVRFLEKEGARVIEICPETAGGLPVPRASVELVNGIAMNTKGENVHREFSMGVVRCLGQLKGQKIEAVILQPRSPSCGVGRIYDGTFSKKLIPGNGLMVQALIREGYKVISLDEMEGL